MIEIVDPRDLTQSLSLKNKEFAKTVMRYLEKSQVLSDDDISVLLSREKCRQLFNSDYNVLLKISDSRSVSDQVRIGSHNRFYSDVFILNGNRYVMTSQLYGFSENPTHKDNRTPFVNWLIERLRGKAFVSREWWPSKDVYNVVISKEQWLDFLSHRELMPEQYMALLANMYSIGGIASCIKMEELFGRTFNYYRNLVGTMGQRAVKFFNVEACNQENATYWPIMFLGHSENDGYNYKIRPELYDALTEINIMQYLEPKQPAIIPFVLPESFSAPVSRRFVNSLLAKPFVILTGNSGTGKTRIATRFAKYMGVQLEDGKNYELVSVGADWTDNTAILGYYNPMGNDGAGKYVDTAILRLFIRAKKHPEYPFFLILDEMNLSHVERYFADFLSHMETPETAFKIENYSEEEFTYPDNLFVIGTVNIDETTYMFSPKVLDRANVIEFKPDKESIFGMFAKQDFDDSIDTADDETVQAFMSLARKIRENGYEKDLTGEADAFRQIYDILEENGFEFAYRTVKEICRYVYAANEIADAFGYNMNNTVDEQIVQKLLPKIYGNRRAIGDMLEKLAKLLEEKQYNLSLTKVRQMQRKLDNTQYVSFI